MGKEKKQSYSNQNNKGGRNIKKDNPPSNKGKDTFTNKGNSQKDSSRKNISYNLYHSHDLPPNKPRPAHTAPSSTQSNLPFPNPNSTAQKKIQSARS